VFFNVFSSGIPCDKNQEAGVPQQLSLIASVSQIRLSYAIRSFIWRSGRIHCVDYTDNHFTEVKIKTQVSTSEIYWRAIKSSHWLFDYPANKYCSSFSVRTRWETL